VDTHLHILQPSRFRYHWLEPESALDRDFHLNEISGAMHTQNVIGGILIEATNTSQEIDWLLALCAHEPFYKGIIGWIDLEDADIAMQIDRFAQSGHFKGVRLNWLDSRPNPKRLDAAMRAVQQHRLVVEVLARFVHLPEIVTFMRSHPDVMFVLDHLGGAAINEAGLEAWRAAMQWLANLPNVTIKISGYGNSAVATLRAYVCIALQTVGSQCLMFGSNWPMFLGTSTYTDLVEHARAAVADWDHATRAAFFHDTAKTIYGLGTGF